MPTNEDEIASVMIEGDTTDDNSILEQEVYNETCDPEWSDNGEDTVEDDNLESNSRRNIR
jgi:hypothetical protein